MRTEQTLRMLLAAREALAPATEPVLAGARQLAARYHRRRVAGAAAAASLTVAAGVTLPVALHQGWVTTGSTGPTPLATAPATSPAVAPSTPPPAQAFSQPRLPYAFTVLAGTFDGFRIEPLTVTPQWQLAEIYHAGEGEPVAGLVVYQPGTSVRVRGETPGWDVTTNPVPVPVRGTTGWYSTSGNLSALRWEHTPGGWAVIGNRAGRLLDEAALRQLAESVRFGEPRSVRVAFRLEWLPAGLQPFAVLQDTGSNRPLRSAIQFESVGQTRSRAMDITVYEDPARDPDRDLQRTWDWWHTSIAGHEAQCADLVDGRRCRIGIDGITVSVGFDPANLDELTRIVAGIQLAIWPDLDSWYDLDTALPVR